MLVGIYMSTMDNSGRIRIPKAFLRVIEAKYGNEVFLTTIDGKSVLIYPLDVWEGVREEIRRNDTKNPLIVKFLIFTSRFGKLTKIDKKGRVLIPSPLRKKTGLKGKIAILGKGSCLEVMLYNERLLV
jgi:division/cell wall cluster transcriptional repressor MraZ